MGWTFGRKKLILKYYFIKKKLSRDEYYFVLIFISSISPCETPKYSLHLLSCESKKGKTLKYQALILLFPGHIQDIKFSVFRKVSEVGTLRL